MKKLLTIICLTFLVGISFAQSPLTGTGSGVGVANDNEIRAWDKLYKTVPTQSLADRLYRRVHRYYSALKGWDIWAVFETNQIEQIKSQNVPVPLAPNELAAWDTLYTNVPTGTLRFFLRQDAHEEHAQNRGFIIVAPDESSYVDSLKLRILQNQ